MAKKEKEIKTNAMRILDRMNIKYTHQSYECEEFVDGLQTAEKLGLPYEKVYKTLVTVGSDKQHYVFVIPIEKELDLKKAAKAVSVKSLAMIHVKEITQITGYVRGGCTSIGMKKQFPTFLHETAGQYDTIFVSAGKVGFQIELSPEDLTKIARCRVADIT